MQMMGGDLEKRKRIAILSEHASPLADPGSVDSGGQNVYVAHVARQLSRQGYQVDVFTRRDDESLPEILVWEDGVRVIHVPAGPAKFIPKEELLPFMDDFTNYLIGFQRDHQPYDLVHANFWMSALVAADIKQALGIPFLVTFHALGKVRRQHQGKKDGFPDARFAIEDRVVAEADRIIAECPQDMQDLLDLYHANPAKIATIPCGFDPSEMWPVDKALARRTLRLPEDERVILQLGRMVPRKGIDTAVRGFARLVKNYGIQARLIIVGGGSAEPDPQVTPEIGRLQEIAREEGVLDWVTFTGRRGRKALKYYYSAADLFVSTPWYEPFGITPIEAMACGTPVIGSNVGGIKSTVEDGQTGYLIPPNDPDALAERMVYLYQNPDEMKRLSQQAINRSNMLFTWQKVGDSIAALFEEVFAENELVRISLGDSMPVQAAASAFPNAQFIDKPVSEEQLAVLESGFEMVIQALQHSRRTLSSPILDAANAIARCLMQGKKVMVCGNGGSAADAQHFAAEFVGRFLIPGRKALPVMALTADTAFLTAWSNDAGYEHVFSRQVEAFGQPGDLLVGISTSGRSPNLSEAFKQARSMGIGCIAFLGGDGGEVLPLADIAVLVPSNSSPRIQEVQILALHLICELVEPCLNPGRMDTVTAESERITTKRQPAWGIQPVIPVQLPRSL